MYAIRSYYAPIDWVVMRNRLSHVNARNKRDVGQLLLQLAKRIGFRLAPGFGERVIFRELFPKGLTLLDLREKGRITSYNVCYTKLLRAGRPWSAPRRSGR